MTASLDPSVPGFIDDPYTTYRALRAEDPVHWSTKLRAWALTRFADSKTFFREPRLTVDRSEADRYQGPKGPRTQRGLMTDGSGYASLRALAGHFLSARDVEALRPRIQTIVDRLLDKAARNGGMDVVADLAFPLPIAVIGDLLGVPEDEREPLLQWGRRTAAGMDHVFSSKSPGGSGMAPGAGLYGLFKSLVTKRRAVPEDDLVSKMTHSEQDGDRLTDDEIANLCVGLLFAGHETTSNLIGNGLLALLRQPEQMQVLRDGAASARSAVEELLRFESPAHVMSRVALDDMDIDGREIRKGQIVLAVLGSMNRDPDAFEDADALRLDRSPNPHIAFGDGTHFCWGAPLTRVEGTVVMPALMQRFDKIELAGPPRWRGTLVLRGLESLPVRVA